MLSKHTMAEYGLLNELKELGNRVAAAGEAARADEEAAEDAPDEFKVNPCLAICLCAQHMHLSLRCGEIIGGRQHRFCVGKDRCRGCGNMESSLHQWHSHLHLAAFDNGPKFCIMIACITAILRWQVPLQVQESKSVACLRAGSM